MISAEREADTLTALRSAVRDPVWWILVVIGPLAWLALASIGPGIAPVRPAVSVLIYGVVLYPLLEELIFRGFLQARLLEIEIMRSRLGPLSLANAITSILFAASHLISQTPLQAASVF